MKTTKMNEKTTKEEKAMKLQLTKNTFEIKNDLKNNGYTFFHQMNHLTCWEKEINSVQELESEIETLNKIGYDVLYLMNETRFCNSAIELFGSVEKVDEWYETQEKKY